MIEWPCPGKADLQLPSEELPVVIWSGVIWPAVRPAIGLAALAIALAASGPAQAQSRLDARYTVTLAGIPIGKGAWVIDVSEDQFTAAASGATAGLLRVFASGQGSGASRGAMVGGVPVPSSFAASITSDKQDRRNAHDPRVRRREGFRDHAIGATRSGTRAASPRRISAASPIR